MFLSPGSYVEDIMVVGEMERNKLTREMERNRITMERTLYERERQPSFTDAEKAGMCLMINAT